MCVSFVCGNALEECQVPEQAQEHLPAKVREKDGVNSLGKTLHYYLNYSSDRRTFSYDHGAGTELLSGKTTLPSQAMTLEPWDVAIIEER